MKYIKTLVLFLAGVLFYGTEAYAALAIVQNVTVATGTGTSLTKAFPSALTNGSVIVAVVSGESSSITATAADGTNGSYGTFAANAKSTIAGGNYQSWIFTKVNAGTATPTVTITFSSSVFGTLKLYEITGQNATPIDVAAGNTEDASVSSVVSLTTTAANDIILAGIEGYPDPPYAVDSGYTAAFSSAGGANSYHWGEYIADSGAAGAKTLAFGALPAAVYAATAVAIKAAAGVIVNPLSGKGGTAARPLSQ